jgi:polysaccharide export outer membrane protein
MKWLTISVLAIVFANQLSSQTQTTSPRSNTEATSYSEGSNLPTEKLGKDDLIGITVYDAPELTRTVRVNSEGDIRLPMLKQHVPAAGLYPVELGSAISTALIGEHILVNPIVTVTVVEYRSRPISVVGAVKNPLTFQAAGTVTLLDAISRAQGLTDNAGAEILVTRQVSGANDKSVAVTQRIPVYGLMNAEDSTLNMHLEGGEEIRVPEAGRIFVAGNVKKPGAFYITNGSQSSIMRALALSGGLDSYTAHKAYIYRLDGDSGSRTEIPVELKKILSRKSPDVALLANDVLYIPDAAGLRAAMKVLQTSVGVGTSLATSFIYLAR